MDRIRKDNNLKMDIIITSPPYNIKKRYSSYKDNKKIDEYLNWLYMVAKNSHDILKQTGSFFLNIGGTPSEPLIPFLAASKFIDAGFQLQNTIHWIKSISIEKMDIGSNNQKSGSDFSIGHFKPITSKRYLTDLHEYIFHFSKTGNVDLEKLSIGVPYQDKSNIKRWKSSLNDKRDRGNVWFITYPTIQTGRPHPAVFPEKLPSLCIQLHGIRKDNFLVYDPFMGIGSTALACLDLGMNYIGTEIDQSYVDTANELIAKRREELIKKK